MVLPPVEHLQLLLSQLDQRLGHQRDEWDGLDRKATTILATTGVLFGLAVNNASTFATIGQPGPSVFLVGLFGLVAGLLAGIAVLWPRTFNGVPEPAHFLAGYASKPTDETIGRLLVAKSKAYDDNRLILHGKLFWLRVEMGLLFVAGALLAVALFIREVR